MAAPFADPELENRHAHYAPDGEPALEWKDLIFTGELFIPEIPPGETAGGVGVTFLSRHPEAIDQVYRFRAVWPDGRPGSSWTPTRGACSRCGWRPANSPRPRRGSGASSASKPPTTGTRDKPGSPSRSGPPASESPGIPRSSPWTTATFAFGRLFRFWVEFEELSQAAGDNNDQAIPVFRPKALHSFPDFNGGWIQPQPYDIRIRGAAALQDLFEAVTEANQALQDYFWRPGTGERGTIGIRPDPPPCPGRGPRHGRGRGGGPGFGRRKPPVRESARAHRGRPG